MNTDECGKGFNEYTVLLIVVAYDKRKKKQLGLFINCNYGLTNYGVHHANSGVQYELHIKGQNVIEDYMRVVKK